MPAAVVAFTVAILPLTKGAGSEEYAGLGKALAGMITTDFSAVEELQLVERERLDELLKEINLGKSGFVEGTTAQKLGKGLGAGYLVTGSYSVVAASFLMDARVVAVESGKIVKAANAKGTIEDFVAVEKALVEDLLAGLSVKLSSAEKRKMIVQAPTESFTAFKAYGEGLDERDKGRTEKARAAFERALAIDPQFEDARAAIESLSNLVEREKEKERSATAKVTSAAHQKILDAHPDERKRPASFQDDAPAVIGFALRMVALENERNYCQRYEEMLHFIERRKWKMPALERNFGYEARKAADGFGYQPIPSSQGGPDHLDDSLDDRVEIMDSLLHFVIGQRGWSNWGDSEGMLGSLKKCFPPQKQLEEVDRLIAKAKQAGVLGATAEHFYPAFRMGEALDLAWCFIRAKRLGANAEIEKRTKALLAGRPEGDATRKQLLDEIEAVARDAKEWSAHQARRLGQPNGTLDRVMRGVAALDPKVVKVDGPYCEPLVKGSKARADSLLLRERELKVDDERGRDFLLDEVGMIFSPLRDMGCLVGVPARFENAEQVIRHERDARKRTKKGAEQDQMCVTFLGSNDRMAWDQMLKTMDDYPQYGPQMIEGILIMRYTLLSNRCVDD
jgi:TolB-like protein